MELNITFTEFALLIWAVFATVAALQAREQARVAQKMLVIFLNDEDARNQIVKAHDKLKSIVRGQQ